MQRLLIALAIAGAAVAVAALLRTRRRTDAPTQPAGRLPAQLDRGDFPRPEAPWLVAVFTSETCGSCRDVSDKAAVLESSEVAVVEVEFGAERALHDRYRVEAVPLTLIADRAGVVRRSFLGPVTATDLWAAVAWTRKGDDDQQC